MNGRLIIAVIFSAALSAPAIAQVGTAPPDQLPGAAPSGTPSSALPPGALRDTHGPSPNCACVRPGASASVESSLSADAAANSSASQVPRKPGARVTGGSQTNVLGCTC